MSLTQLRICLDPAEYARKRQPFFIRFVDSAFKFHHSRVESFSFVRDCVLEVRFLFDDATDKLPAQMPLVCYDPNDSGEADDSEGERDFREIYRAKCERIAAVRNRLDTLFPLCDQKGVGYLEENNMFVVIRLLPDFHVAITSTVSIFHWNNGIATGVTTDSMHFKTVDKVVRYADRKFPGMRTGGLYFKSEKVTAIFIRSPPRLLTCVPQIIAENDLLRARVHHLRCAFPDLWVASFGAKPDEVVLIAVCCCFYLINRVSAPNVRRPPMDLRGPLQRRRHVSDHQRHP